MKTYSHYKASARKYIYPTLLTIFSLVVLYLIVLSTPLGSKLVNQNYTTARAIGIIDVTPEAVQTVYQNGVPHIGKDKVFRTTYDPNQSFFLNGLFWITDEQRDSGAVPALTNAGFNSAFSTIEANPNFLINQIQGNINYLVTVAEVGNPNNVIASTTTTNTSVTINDPDLVLNTTYEVSVCVPDCINGTLVKKGTSVAKWVSGSAAVSFSWKDGSDFAFFIDNRIVHDGNGNFDPTTFNEQRFQSFKSNPNVFGWWMADEGWKLSNVFNSDVSANYQDISDVVSGHIDQTNSIMVVSEGEYDPNADPELLPLWSDFVNLGEVGSVYHYPKIFPTSTPLQTLNGTAELTKKTKQALSPEKPVWFIPEAYTGWPGAVYMTPQEAKAQVYTAIIHGSTGLIHFLWDSCEARTTLLASQLAGIRPNLQLGYENCPGSKILDQPTLTAGKALWDAFDANKYGINKEIADLTPVIISPTSTLNYSVYVDNKPNNWSPIRTMLKQYNGYYYLLAVNVDNATINTQLFFPRSLAEVTNPIDGKKITTSGAVINQSFAPFATKVYKFRLDSDSDGFSDNLESYMGTNPLDSCPETNIINDEPVDTWPPDFNDDKSVSIHDISLIRAKFGTTEARYDLNGDGGVNVADISITVRYYGQSCTN